ncbi:hypothetical protein [Sulfurospirillum multivorans]|uniref:Uncharacterized protein n=2 Tax=Sulfurospirillum multivorans TaxID=66821 RepID=A0AA86ALV3_SULMK|nr:hypothetical protein [Sulfurospirillum multivorans]AHJ13101.1 hypothetical protein SMUL_1846 [Sulfurospirillum multivorans DSM 12446]QEH06589.1 hypothetical protein SMN_1824 [Sulfurospirillum multivorans]
MKKSILFIVTIFSVLELNASEVSRASIDPMQELKDLVAAEERHINGEATFTDKVILITHLGPSMKRLQEEIVYKTSIKIEDPSYLPIANGALIMLDSASTALDIYSIKTCSNDLSNFTNEDMKAITASNEFASAFALKQKTLTSNDHMPTAKRADYVRFIHALRAANCKDSDAALQKYLETK